MKILDRYLHREIILAFLLSLGFIFLVILLNEFFYLAEIVFTARVSGGTAARLLLYLLPSIVSLAIPLAFMAGVLGGLGRLAGDGEAEALRLLGISPLRILRPVLHSGFVLFLICSFFTLWLTPVSNYRWLQTMIDSVLNRPTLEIEPGNFVEWLPGKVIFVETKDKEGFWRHVFICQRGEEGELEVILAEKAWLQFQPDYGDGWIMVDGGRLYSFQPDRPESFKFSEFQRGRQKLQLKILRKDFSRAKRVREKTIRELWRESKTITGVSDYESRLIRLEIHKRFSLPATCLLFVFLGVALGWKRWPGGRLGSYGLALLFILGYYFLLVTGEQKTLQGDLAPWLAMWLPNLIILLAGGGLFWRWFKDIESARVKLPDIKKITLKTCREAGRSLPVRKKFLLSGIHPFLSLVDRYVLSFFVRLMAPVFAGLVLGMSAVTFLLRLEMLRGNRDGWRNLLFYLWHKFPEFLLYSLLLSIPAAAALALGLLWRRKEIPAFFSTGLSYARVIRVLVIAGLLLIPGIFLWQDRVLVYSNPEAEELWSRESGEPVRTFSYLSRYWLRVKEPGTFYHYELLSPEMNLIGRFLMLETYPDGSGFKKIVFAREALVKQNSIILRYGWERDFSEDETHLSLFDFKETPAPGTADLLLKKWKEPSAMSVFELDLYARELKEAGFPARRFQVEADFRRAFSLSALVMILLACASAGVLAARGFLLPLAVSLAGAFLYWQTVALLRGLSLSGLLAPAVAAWSGPAIFILAAVYMLLKVKT
ncbi:MAG: LptF/LptG family permease [Candidatus Saccharicenans sp.]